MPYRATLSRIGRVGGLGRPVGFLFEVFFHRDGCYFDSFDGGMASTIPSIHTTLLFAHSLSSTCIGAYNKSHMQRRLTVAHGYLGAVWTARGAWRRVRAGLGARTPRRVGLGQRGRMHERLLDAHEVGGSRGRAAEAGAPEDEGLEPCGLQDN